MRMAGSGRGDIATLDAREGLWSRMRDGKHRGSGDRAAQTAAQGCAPGGGPSENSKAKKGTLLNEAKRGTFLTRLDELGELGRLDVVPR